ncbi:efflux RND transporter periplasmic adaptor subunit [Algoriphagus namhaensis]
MNKSQKNIVLISFGMLATGVLMGYLFFGASKTSEQTAAHEHLESVTGIPSIYTCSMHPQIRQSEPGDCPICGMDLIPVADEKDDSIDPSAIKMSPSAMKLANIQTMVVSEDTGSKTLRLNGKIQKDERRSYTQSAHISGRVEDLSVTFTGQFVSQGEVLGHLYSPELVTAQEELLQAYEMRENYPKLYLAAREKLKNWKLVDSEIEQILTKQSVTDKLPVHANVSGFVTEKMVSLGDYVRQGEPLYQIADLSKVWVLFEIYESELAWIKKGDRVSFTVSALPGRNFSGTVEFIDPLIDPQTRVALARVEVSNPDLLLKPEMFVSGVVEAKGSLEQSGTITVPKSAVMWTGKRSVVYVKSENPQGISFAMREVTLGPSLESSFVIESGLRVGEEVAINGTFSIDAAAQLAGKPSMMNPTGGQAPVGHEHGGMSAADQTRPRANTSLSAAAKNALKPMFDTYFQWKDALTEDDFQKALKDAKAMNTALSEVPMKLFEDEAHDLWMSYQRNLKKITSEASRAESIKKIRETFVSTSAQMILLSRDFDVLDQTLYVQFCPMVNNNRGATWLSLNENIVNPYFGESMLTCGEIEEVLYQ